MLHAAGAAAAGAGAGDADGCLSGRHDSTVGGSKSSAGVSTPHRMLEQLHHNSQHPDHAKQLLPSPSASWAPAAPTVPVQLAMPLSEYELLEHETHATPEAALGQQQQQLEDLERQQQQLVLTEQQLLAGKQASAQRRSELLRMLTMLRPDLAHIAHN